MPVEKTCRLLELSKSRYYDWRKKWFENGPDGLKDQTSGPEACPHQLLPEERRTVIEMALEHPNRRHRKLAKWMQNEGIAFVSESSVYRLLKRQGLIPSRPVMDRPDRDGEITVSRPNEMWHSDITYIPVGNGHAYLISFLDGYSRKIIHHELCRDMTATTVERLYDEALKKAGLLEADEKPILVTDHGSQYLARSFTHLLNELDVEHRLIAIGHPEANGKIEVFHKTIKYEHVYVQQRYDSFYQAKDDIDQFVRYYNTKRLHQSIGYVTPEQKYQGEAEAIIEEREQKHQEAIERRKRLNRQRNQAEAKSGKTTNEFSESV